MYTTGIEKAPCIDCKVLTDQTMKNPAPICSDCLLARDGKLYKSAVLGDGRVIKAAGNQMGIFV